jgi:hypothetical protein
MLLLVGASGAQTTAKFDSSYAVRLLNTQAKVGGAGVATHVQIIWPNDPAAPVTDRFLLTAYHLVNTGVVRTSEIDLSKIIVFLDPADIPGEEVRLDKLVEPECLLDYVADLAVFRLKKSNNDYVVDSLYKSKSRAASLPAIRLSMSYNFQPIMLGAFGNVEPKILVGGSLEASTCSRIGEELTVDVAKVDLEQDTRKLPKTAKYLTWVRLQGNLLRGGYSGGPVMAQGVVPNGSEDPADTLEGIVVAHSRDVDVPTSQTSYIPHYAVSWRTVRAAASVLEARLTGRTFEELRPKTASARDAERFENEYKYFQGQPRSQFTEAGKGAWPEPVWGILVRQKSGVKERNASRVVVATYASDVGADLSRDAEDLRWRLDVARKDLAMACFRGVKFTCTKKEWNYLRQYNLKGAVFDNCILEGISFVGGTLDFATFHKCDLRKAVFKPASGYGVTFTGKCTFDDETDLEGLRRCRVSDVAAEGLEGFTVVSRRANGKGNPKEVSFFAEETLYRGR